MACSWWPHEHIQFSITARKSCWHSYIICLRLPHFWLTDQINLDLYCVCKTLKMHSFNISKTKGPVRWQAASAEEKYDWRWNGHTPLKRHEGHVLDSELYAGLNLYLTVRRNSSAPLHPAAHTLLKLLNAVNCHSFIFKSWLSALKERCGIHVPL